MPFMPDNTAEYSAADLMAQANELARLMAGGAVPMRGNGKSKMATDILLNCRHYAHESKPRRKMAKASRRRNRK
jgi:hypothetical protein